MAFDTTVDVTYEFDADGLPKKLSDLIEVALYDLEKCEADPKFKIEMSTWFDKYTDKNGVHCEVCFAGAVLAQTIPYKVKDIKHRSFEFCFNDIEDSIGKKLQALDHVRNGDMQGAFEEFDIDIKDQKYEKYDCVAYGNYTPYETSRAGFKDYLCELIADLRADGL